MALQEAPDFKEVKHEAERRAALKRQHIETLRYGQPVATSLRLFGACAVVLFESQDKTALIDSIRLRLDDSKIHIWGADGNIQGKTLDQEAAKHAQSELLKMPADNLIVVNDVDYSGKSGSGTPVIYDGLSNILSEHFKGCYRSISLPMILAVGHGSIKDITTSPSFDRRAQGGWAEEITNRFAIVDGGSPVPYIEPLADDR